MIIVVVVIITILIIISSSSNNSNTNNHNNNNNSSSSSGLAPVPQRVPPNRNVNNFGRNDLLLPFRYLSTKTKKTVTILYLLGFVIHIC